VSPNRIPAGYMTVKDASEALGVTTKTIHRMLDRGRLTRYKDPISEYHVFIKTEEVERVLEGPVLVARG
jgi:excisionase family DNA binding protein